MEIHIFEVFSSRKEKDEFIWDIQNLRLEDGDFFKKIISNQNHLISVWPLCYDPIEDVANSIGSVLDEIFCETLSIFVENDESEKLVKVLELSTFVLLGKADIFLHVDGPYMIQLITSSANSHEEADAKIRLESFCPVDFLDPRVIKDKYLKDKGLGSN